MDNLICNSYIFDTNITQQMIKKIDFNKIDIINIAFSVLEKNVNGFYVPILNKGLQEKIFFLKNYISSINAKTKMVISIGGWGADHFCSASSSEQSRRAFAAECKKLLEVYGIDGIDVDWEFPGENFEGTTGCKNCKKDFIKLVAEIRAAIGGKLLTCAVGSNRYHGIDGKKLNKIVDYINIMTYDMGASHQSHMLLVKMFVNGWIHIGIDKQKILVGVPFYSRSRNKKYEWFGYSTVMDNVKNGKAKIVYKKYQDYTLIGNSKLTMDTPHSIKLKANYVKKKGLAGLFNWEESSDFNGELRSAMFEGLQKK